jgi:hypothetical protein
MVKSKNYIGNNIICEYDSSNLKGANYETTTKKLVVTFGNGTQYEYNDVPHEIFAELNLAESQGKYFNQKIAKTYTYKKIES